MEPMDAVRTRRSIRKFTDEAVPVDMVDTILKAAMPAPSAAEFKAEDRYDRARIHHESW